jgi:integrase
MFIRAHLRDISGTPPKDIAMARRIRSSMLETRTARLKLPARKRPYFVTIDRGTSLGYRRNKIGSGRWVLRNADGKGGKGPEQSFAFADDYVDHNGNDILDYWHAQDRARASARAGDSNETVGSALDRYEADLKLRGGDRGNVARVRGHLPAVLASTPLAALRVRDFRVWRDGLAGELAPATVNRTANGFRAALNLAADNDERIVNRRAWETGLASIHDAEESRNVILDEPTIRTIIGCAYEQSSEFGLLMETAAATGARVSQLARLEVQDLQDSRSDPRLMMPSSHKGRGQKKISRRPVPIPPSLAAKLRNIANGRAPDASLLIKPSGKPWKKSDHSRLVARAVRAASLDPGEVTMYALRHSSIVRQLLAGVPVRVVAVNHDTSVVMIERNYSRYIGDHADTLARKALLDFAAPAAGNVVPRATAR